jgi:hypothetical protein
MPSRTRRAGSEHASAFVVGPAPMSLSKRMTEPILDSVPRVYDRGGSLPAIPLAPGESLRRAIAKLARDGRPTFRVVAGLFVPHLWRVPSESLDGELTIELVALDSRPPEVGPQAWAALCIGDAFDADRADQRSYAQLKRLTAAGLRDVCGWAGADVAASLGYRDEFAACRAARRGRELWSWLHAWPWACVEQGMLRPRWWEQPAARLGWRLWAKGS